MSAATTMVLPTDADLGVMNASKYEDYHTASRHYDGVRWAGAAKGILARFAEGPTPLDQQQVLDLGCGTGNYSYALAPSVGCITCLDGNSSMLALCRRKLTAASPETPARFTLGDITKRLPFEDDSFDSVSCTMVLHHLDDATTRGTWERVAHVVREVRRVLKPGGVVVFEHILPEQLRARWYLDHYLVDFREKAKGGLIPRAALHDFMAAAGLEGAETRNTDYVLFKDYLDPLALMDAEYRRASSVWTMAKEAEVELALARIREDHASGAIGAKIAASEELRGRIGHTSLTSARKPLAARLQMEPHLQRQCQG